MKTKNNEYLFLAFGYVNNIHIPGISLRSSDKSINILSLKLDEDIFPPYPSHKLLLEEVILIRDYFNDYINKIFRQNNSYHEP